MAQVKFYSVAALPSENVNAGGVYFVDNGELYKGTQRFGLGRVTVDAEFVPSTSSKTGQARGDIVVTGSGAAWVYDGTSWQSVGGDTSSLQSMWQADISTWTSGLVAGGGGSYITGITQGEDGKVTASAAAFPTLNLDSTTQGATSNGVTVSVTTQSGAVTGVTVAAPSYVATEVTKASTSNGHTVSVTTKDGQVTGVVVAAPSRFSATEIAEASASGTGNGITVSVTTSAGAVTGVAVEATDISCSTVTASAGTFTDLTVSGTASFVATTVSASSLTVGGSTVQQIADAQIAAIASSTVTSTATGITVGVTTSGGSVTAVTVNASSFGNVMHFLGVGSVWNGGGTLTVEPPFGTTPVAGDIVIDGTTGLEAICTGVSGDPATYTWELIGDNAVYALEAYSSSATVFNGVATVPGALNAAGAAIDALTTSFANLGTAAWMNSANTLTSTGTSLPTESAVAAYVSSFVSTEIGKLDATVSSSSNGVGIQVVESDGKLTSASITGVGTAASVNFATTLDSSASTLPTCSAVAAAIDAAALVWLDASGNAI